VTQENTCDGLEVKNLTLNNAVKSSTLSVFVIRLGERISEVGRKGDTRGVN